MPTLKSISPLFIVDAIQDAVEFYNRSLGFDVNLLVPEDDPFFALLVRDEVVIALKEIGRDVHPVPNPGQHPDARWDAFIEVDDPDALSREFSGNDVNFREPLGDTDDGLRGFAVYDHDGYVLFFGRPITVG